MIMTDDQRNNEAQRLSGQLLLDAQRRPSSQPNQYLNDVAPAVPQLVTRTRVRREWEEAGMGGSGVDVFPQSGPRPVFLGCAE